MKNDKSILNVNILNKNASIELSSEEKESIQKSVLSLKIVKSAEQVEKEKILAERQAEYKNKVAAIAERRAYFEKKAKEPLKHKPFAILSKIAA